MIFRNITLAQIDGAMRSAFADMVAREVGAVCGTGGASPCYSGDVLLEAGNATTGMPWTSLPESFLKAAVMTGTRHSAFAAARTFELFLLKNFGSVFASELISKTASLGGDIDSLSLMQLVEQPKASIVPRTSRYTSLTTANGQPEGSACLSQTGMCNVYGEALERCDRNLAEDPHYPRTGYSRTDFCADYPKAAGTPGTSSSDWIGGELNDIVCLKLPAANFTYLNNTQSFYYGYVFPYSPYWTLTYEAKSLLQAAFMPLPGPWCIAMRKFFWHRSYHPETVGLVECRATNAWVIQNLIVVYTAGGQAGLKAICSRCDIKNKAIGGGTAGTMRKACAEVGL